MATRLLDQPPGEGERGMQSAPLHPPIPTHQPDLARPLPLPRRSTDSDLPPPSPSLSINSSNALASAARRNRSPYGKHQHLRTRSSAGSLAAPTMTRAYTSPVVDSSSTYSPSVAYARSASPITSVPRRHSPLRHSILDDSFYPSFSSFSPDLEIEPTISEHAELHVAPRPPPEDSAIAPHNAFPRSRRRPVSPLLSNQAFQPHGQYPPSPLHTSTSSPSLNAARFNESYPTSMVNSMTSSMPSTPTSLRSRSPSISSLETIPDSPEAELEAEEDVITTLKLAGAPAEKDSEGHTMVRRGSLESVVRGRGMADKRKRWSVCGAERRGDFEMETIWED